MSAADKKCFFFRRFFPPGPPAPKTDHLVFVLNSCQPLTCGFVWQNSQNKD